MKETIFLNEDAIKSMLDEYSRQNKREDAEYEISAKLNEQLHLLIKAYLASKPEQKSSILERYKHLNPNSEQIRTALIMLLNKKTDNGKDLFCQKNHWLSVFKVLCFLGIKKEIYACIADIEKYVMNLNLGIDKPFCKSFADALHKKNVESFHGDLYKWEKAKDQKGMNDFWLISITFLQILEEICETEYQSKTDDTKVNTEAV